jgi:hypothetical protein
MLLHELGGVLQRLAGVDRDHRAPHEIPACMAAPPDPHMYSPPLMSMISPVM